MEIFFFSLVLEKPQCLKVCLPAQNWCMGMQQANQMASCRILKVVARKVYQKYQMYCRHSCRSTCHNESEYNTSVKVRSVLQAHASKELMMTYLSTQFL